MAEFVDVIMTHAMDEPPDLVLLDDKGHITAVGRLIANDVNDDGVWTYTVRIQHDDIEKL